MSYHHVSVMPNEAIDYLNCRPGRIYVDCTLGGSGHAERILKKTSPHGILIGIDQDMDAIENAEIQLSPYRNRVRFEHGNFADLHTILLRHNIPAVDGILLDLGLSFHQIEKSGRGFSFRKDEPLDMRMDTRLETTAEDLVNRSSEKELAQIFREYGEERRAGQIARRIVDFRKKKPIRSSLQLAELIRLTVPAKLRWRQRIHPATRVFMALRIAVNQELEKLSGFMERAMDLLNPAGRLCVISFHSLEDRIVKQRMREWEKGCTCPPGFPVCTCGKRKQARLISRKAIKPSEAECSANPMARSARMRVAEKCSSDEND